jgi:hypothetical protein
MNAMISGFRGVEFPGEETAAAQRISLRSKHLASLRMDLEG